MIDINALLKNGENINIEYKLALKELPKNVWETYSAFANTSGGIILLGIKEETTGFKIEGVQNPQKLIKEIWSCLHNPNKISTCILFERHVYSININERTIIVIEVPRADRHEQPVYIGADMFLGTYCRNGDGDFRCSREAVLAMLRDNIDESLDSKLVDTLELSCLNAESIGRYRQMFNYKKTNHIWCGLPDEEFLIKIGAASKDYVGVIRPTRAGILAFSDFLTITSIYPNYFLDYREINDINIRWADRVSTNDSTWSGNVFDFYFKIMDRLTSGIKIPFKLDGVFRETDTPLHASFREILANTLIHADYNGRLGIVIEKDKHSIKFSNPGLFRIDVNTAILGGISDTRNKNLFHIFALIQLVEHAGSGLCTLFENWNNAGLPQPVIVEDVKLSRTTVSLVYRTQPAEVTNGQLQEEVAQKPSAQKSIAQKLSAQKLSAQKPSAQKLAAKKPSAQKPTAQKSTAQKNNKFLETQICYLIQQNSAITTEMIAAELNVSRYVITRRIKHLKEDGYLERIGSDRSGHWLVLKIPE